MFQLDSSFKLFHDILSLEREWAKSPQGYKKIPWSFRKQLPETLFHHILQKVRGFVVGFIGLRNGTTSAPKILLTSWVVKGEIAFANSPGKEASGLAGIGRHLPDLLSTPTYPHFDAGLDTVDFQLKS